jgi:chaperone modulatory protein CbpM
MLTVSVLSKHDKGSVFMSNTVVYTTKAICLYHKISNDILSDMVSWGIASPSGATPERWLFSQDDYDRIGSASRFNKDLDINIPGAAMALQLLEELDRMRREVRH